MDVSGQADELARLGVIVERAGVDETEASLKRLGDTGAKTEQQLTSSGAAISRSLGAQSQAMKEGAAAEAEYTSGTEGLLAAQRRWLAELPPLTAAERQLQGATRLTTEEVNKAALAFDRMVAAQEASLYTTRAVVKAEAEAYAIEGQRNGLIGQLTAGQGAHGLQLGRVNQELGTFIGRLTGTNTAVTRLTAQLGGAVVGYGSMIAILGGVALAAEALTVVYDKLTESSRKAREENERLLKVLDDVAKKRSTSEAGNLDAAIAAGRARLADLQRDLDNAQRAQRTPVAAYGGGGLAPGTDAAAAQKAVDDAKAKVASAEAELTELVRKSAQERANLITQDLASIVRSGSATAAQLDNAKKLVLGYQQSLDALQKSGSSDLTTIVDLTSKIHALNDALYPKQRVPTLGTEKIASESATLLGALDKQLDEMRKVEAQNQKAALADRQAAEAIGVHGGALDLLTAKHKAERDALDAVQRYVGDALTQRLAQIEATRAQEEASARLKLRIEDEAQAHKANTDAMKSAEEQAKRNIEQTKKWDAETAETIRKQQTYANDLGKIWREGLGSIFTDGLKSWNDFFEDVFRTFSRLMERMQREHKDSGLGYALLGAGASAIAGGSAGYAIGQYGANAAGGAGAGAFAGALTGAQIAGPVGAVVGGLAGAVGGLLGAADAHRRAAKELQDAARAFATNLAQYGASGSIASAVGENNAKAEQLRQQAQDLLSKRIQAASKGGFSEAEIQDVFGQFNKDIAGITAAQAQNAKKIADDFWASIRQGLNSLNGPAGTYQNSLDQIEQAYRDNVAAVLALDNPLLDLAKFQRDLAKVEELRIKQEAALKAAEDERLRQQQFSLDAREAYAKGLTAEGDRLTRQAEEDRQRFQAEQEGWSDADKARLVYIQGLEDERAALKALHDAQTDYLNALAQGPTGTIDTQLLATLSPLRDKLKADQDDYDYAVKRLNADIADGADAATIAADKNAVLTESYRVAGDQAAITAAEFQAAAQRMQQAQSDIQRDIALGFKTPGQGREAEANAFFGPGGSTLTNDQIRALYTPFSGEPLTNKQEEINKNIEQFFRDFPDAVAQAVSGGTGREPAAGERQALINAAQSISEATGSRLADYTSSLLGEVRFIRADVHTIAGGAALRPNLAGSELSAFLRSLTPATPSSLAALSSLSALPSLPSGARVQSTSSGATAALTIGPVNFNVRVIAPEGADAKQFGDDFIRQIEPQLEAVMYRLARAAQKKAGDPTIPG